MWFVWAQTGVMYEHVMMRVSGRLVFGRLESSLDGAIRAVCVGRWGGGGGERLMST